MGRWRQLRQTQSPAASRQGSGPYRDACSSPAQTSKMVIDIAYIAFSGYMIDNIIYHIGFFASENGPITMYYSTIFRINMIVI